MEALSPGGGRKKRSERRQSSGRSVHRPADPAADLSAARTLHRDAGAEWSLEAGDELGGFRVVKPLGRGGMGEVYLVENVGMGFRYALKLLPEEFAEDADFRGRFRREARVMAELSHPNIVHVHHMAEEAGRHFLVMDYIEGRNEAPITLADEIRIGKITSDRTRRIALELCEALGAAHDHGVVHRDIKPGNVLLDADDKAYLGDFGLARVVGEDLMRSLLQKSISLSTGAGEPGSAALTEGEHSLVGTYEYMSPEQRASGAVDERSDIYSLGLVIYGMLTARRAEGRFPMPSELGCPLWWDGVVEKALASEPAGRYATASEMHDELEHRGAGADDDEPAVIVRPLSPPPGALRLAAARRRRERRRRNWYIGALFLSPAWLPAVLAYTFLVWAVWMFFGGWILLAAGRGGHVWWWEADVPDGPPVRRHDVRHPAALVYWPIWYPLTQLPGLFLLVPVAWAFAYYYKPGGLAADVCGKGIWWWLAAPWADAFGFGFMAAE